LGGGEECSLSLNISSMGASDLIPNQDVYLAYNNLLNKLTNVFSSLFEKKGTSRRGGKRS
jgi:hypothetical protein